MFCRYALRTTDAEAGRRFYAEAIGLALPDGLAEGTLLEAWPLHERARAAGVPPHWLGQIAVPAAEAAVARLVERGAERLGPSVQTRSGTTYATVRDPSGAVVSLRETEPPTAELPVVWHQLHTADLERCWSLYTELFGWAEAGAIDVPDPAGGHRLFAWQAGGEPAGSMANTARWKGVHAHWLFHFPVDDVEAAVQRVRALGGTAMEPIALPSGMRLAACEDPQGAAFGIAQRR